MAAFVKKQSIDWSAYEAKAVLRGNLMLFISPELAKAWYPGYDDRPRKSGGQTIYTDRCIEDVMALKYLFGISYRHLEGLIKGFKGVLLFCAASSIAYYLWERLGHPFVSICIFFSLLWIGFIFIKD